MARPLRSLRGRYDSRRGGGCDEGVGGPPRREAACEGTAASCAIHLSERPPHRGAFSHFAVVEPLRVTSTAGGAAPPRPCRPCCPSTRPSRRAPGSSPT